MNHFHNSKLFVGILILFISISLFAFASAEYSGYCGGEGDGKNLTWTLSDDGKLKIFGTGKMMDYTYSTIIWGNDAYNVRSVEISDSVESIGNYAFSHCYQMTSISIPDSVTRIGDSAFALCGITSITIPNHVTTIEDGVFYETPLASITIPDSITSIGRSAFGNCYNLTSVTIPNSVTSIGPHAFSNCQYLTDVTISNSVTSIGNGAFDTCTSLTNITLSDNITCIDEQTFCSCSGLKSITLPQNLISIGPRAFLSNGLTSIEIPASVTKIDEAAFVDCDYLGGVTIRARDIDIAPNAFKEYTGPIYVYSGSKAETWANTYHANQCILLDMYTVTVSGDGHGLAVSDISSGTEGTIVTLTSAPFPGYQFKEWQVLSGGVTIKDNKFTIGAANVEVKAVFEKIPEPDPGPEIYTVTVTNDGNGLAAANPSSGVSGTEVILVAAPNDGYQFKEWQVVSGGITIEKNKFTIGTANVEIKAVFEKAPEPEPETYTIKVTNDGNGLGVADPTSGATGTEVTLAYAPFDGYQFKEWQVVSGGITIEKNKFTIGTANVEIKAVFEKAPEPEPETYTVKVTSDGNGLGVADPTSGVTGTEVTLVYAPFEGFQFKEWQVVSGGITIEKNKFTIGTSNVEIKAVFEKIPEPTSVIVAGGKYELTSNKKSAIFVGPEKKNAKTLVIQDTVIIGKKTYKVTEIAAGACKGMSKLTTLTIGKNVKTIGKEAFYKCKKAKTIKILGTALKKVGANAFAGTPSKATVTCPKKKIKAYTKLLQDAGLSKKAVFKELK